MKKIIMFLAVFLMQFSSSSQVYNDTTFSNGKGYVNIDRDSSPGNLRIKNPQNIAPWGSGKINWNGHQLPRDTIRRKSESLIDGDSSSFVEFRPFQDPNNDLKPEIVIDLMHEYEIDSIKINTFSGNLNLRPIKFTLFYALDSLDYSILERVDSNSLAVFTLALSSPLSLRYIKISIDSVAYNISTVLSEIEVFGESVIRKAKFISKDIFSNTYNTIKKVNIQADVPEGTSVKYRIRRNGTEQSEFKDYADTLLNYPVAKNFAYEIWLESNDTLISPTVYSISIQYEPLDVYPDWTKYDVNNSGLPTNELWKLGVDNDNALWIGTSYNGLIKYSNDNWEIIDTSNSSLKSLDTRTFCFAPNGDLWLQTKGGILKYADNLWEFFPFPKIEYKKGDVIEVDDDDNVWLEVKQGLLSSLVKFNGTEWKEYGEYYFIESIKYYDNRIWFGCAPNGLGEIHDNDSIYFHNWQNSPLNSVVVDLLPSRYGGLIVTQQDYNLRDIYKIINGTWERIAPSPELYGNTYIKTFEFPNQVYWFIGSPEIPIWNGDSFTILNAENSPFAYGVYKKDAILDNEGNIWISTYNAGLFKYKPYGVTSVKNPATTNLIDNFQLLQNYPNPFNPTTNIRYQISETGLVRLKVYDILGNEVADLVNEEKIPGEYEVNFNGSSLSSGVYFYTLSHNSKIHTNKMLLLK